LISFSLVIGLGFLLMVSLVINTILALITEKLFSALGEAETVLALVLNNTIIFLIITGLFAIIYKVLPDAKIRWRDTLVGAGFTSILFMLGKFGIGYYIGTSDMATQYGAAASVILLLTWVYYSSIILYFGAEFTKVWALKRGKGIAPAEHAVFVARGIEVETAVHPKDDAKTRNREVPVYVDGVALPSEEERRAALVKEAEAKAEEERKALEAEASGKTS
jgi:membrane protein